MSDRLELFTLGGGRFQRSGEPVLGLTTKKAEALLIYLASTRRPQPREVLAELLWDDRSQSQSMGNLRGVLTNLRQELGEYLVITRQVVCINPETEVWLDATELEDRLAETRKQGPLNAATAKSLAGTLTLYQGEFLQGFNVFDCRGFEDWSVRERERLHHLVVDGLSELVTFEIDQQEYRLGMAYAARLLELDPLMESAHRQMMQLLVYSCQRVAALNQYETCQKLLRKELGVEPDEETRSLYEQIRTGKSMIREEPVLTVETSSLKKVQTHRHNLPVQLTSFIGREREMGELKKLLAGTHLLTLTGIGGTGKTRLALQVSADLIQEFPGGVWLVELAPLRDPALVEQTVASVLGVTEQADRLLSDLLVEYVCEKHLLLILDNCEHVVEASAQLADLLLRCAPRLKVLATSREHLNLTGETTYPVLPLALPESDRAAATLALAQYEAVRLFIDRATAVQPSFSVTNENAPAVAQICIHLDGIPLAIELAAARTRHLSPEQISSRLGDRFNLLTGGDRTALPRQQTLRAAMDWSYDLLSEVERNLFNRLSIFAGSFSLEAVEVICAGEIGDGTPASRISGSQVLDLLSALVNQSLVSMQEKHADTRYILLETVRQYAFEKLQGSGEWLTLQDRHLAYYLRLAQEGEPHARVGEFTWMKRFETEYDNFRIAMEHAIATHPESAILLENSLAWFIDFTNRNKEAYGWAIRTLAITDAWTPGKMRAMALNFAGDRTGVLGEHQKALELLEASLEMARELGDKNLEKDSLQALTSEFYSQPDWLQMHHFAEQHLVISRELGDKVGIQDGLWQLGESISQSGDNQTGRRYLEQALELARQENYPNGITFALHSLARIARLEGDNTKAIELYTECAQIRRKMGHRGALVWTLIRLAQVYLEEGDSIQASALSEESLAISRELKIIKPQIFCLAGFAASAGLSGQDGRAVRFFGAIEAASEKLDLKMDAFDHKTYNQIIAASRERLGETEFNGLWAEGRKLTLEQALELAIQ